MPLSCSCDYDGDGDYAWSYSPPKDYSVFGGKRRKRCSSCNALIDIGAICAKFARNRLPISDVEERIYGEDGEIDLADMTLCEECADMYFSLSALGFKCVAPDENMRDLCREYAEIAKYGEFQ